MKMISSKSKVILAKIGIPTYVKRDNLGQNVLKTITVKKRDKILAALELPLGKQKKEEQDLFISIMNTMTCQKPLIEEFSKSFNPKDTKELSSVIQMASNKTNGIISFGITINTTTKFIQAPSLSSIIDNPDLKKPLWEKIKKTFIK